MQSYDTTNNNYQDLAHICHPTYVLAHLFHSVFLIILDWLNVMQDYLSELRNPSIELVPFRSVYVLGEVNLPGRYNVHPANDNLAGAVSLAGGATPDGDVTNMRIVRDGIIVLDGIAGEQRLAELGIRSGDQLFIGRRGWLDRNSTFIASAILSLSGIVVAILAGGGGG